MKTGTAIRYTALCMVFLLCVLEPAGALTFVGQTKNLKIDADWQITGVYTYDLKITDPADIGQIKDIIHHIAAHSDQFKGLLTEIRMPDGRKTSLDPDEAESLPAETSVRIAFEISAAFPGFTELFADYMHIDQDNPVQKVAYRITFPRELTFFYRVAQEDEAFQHRRRANFFAWSVENVRRLDIMISTAESWEQIAQRYQTHFQKKLGKGMSGIDLKEPIENMDEKKSSAEKINAVLNFLKTGIDYRAHLNPGNRLFPDEPSAVLDRRWGDCKDIALLGTIMLQAMGVDAFVVLAGKPRINGGMKSIPDPFIFDHALIGVADSRRTTYYDAFIPGGNVIPDDQQIYVHLKVFNDAGQ